MKYKLSNKSIEYDGKILFQIIALEDNHITGVKKGDAGGFIEHIGNLSQSGMCWVYDGAMVYESASIRDNAIINSGVIVKGYEVVNLNEKLSENIIVSCSTFTRSDGLVIRVKRQITKY